MKCLCCLFTCLTTRAVQFEVDRSVDTDSCLIATNNFFARRGKQMTIIGDNGIDFVRSSFEETFAPF